MINKDLKKKLAEINAIHKNDLFILLNDPEGSNFGVERTSSGRLSIDLPFGGGTPNGRIIELYGPESSGKAQPISSHILTPKGWITMGYANIGQEICTPDGTNSTILGVYPQGEQDVYEITLDDKTTVRCTLDHLWAVQTRYSKYKEILTLKALIEKGLKNNSGIRKFKLDSISPVDFESKGALLIHPYLLGVLLGDGSLRKNSIGFSNIDEELLSNVTNILSIDYPELSLKSKGNGIDYRITNKQGRGSLKNKLLNNLRIYYLADTYSYEKHIPNEYLFSSKENRIELIRGLMDSDGFIGTDGTISFTSTSLKLMNGFEFLCRSLGMRVTVSNRFTEYKKQNGDKVSGRRSYTAFILFGSLKFSISKLTRKQSRVNNKLSSHRYRFIESIKKIGREECQCIKIGHPDSLYITDNFIPTHNTTIALHIASTFQKKQPKKLVAFLDYEHSFDKVYAEKLGVDIDNLVFAQPTHAEQGLQGVDDLLDTNDYSLIIIDSIAAMVPKKELEGDIGDSSIGVQARIMSQTLRKITGKANTTKTTIIFTNQMREKIGVMFGSPWVTSGGNALKFYASIRAEVKRGPANKDKEGNVTGNRGELYVVKNKTFPPYKRSSYDMEFGVGISEEGEIVDYGVESGIIKKSGSWFSYGDTKLGQGRDGVKLLLADNPELKEELSKKIREVVV